MSEKPEFDPSKPFEAVKPDFDPSKPFETPKAEDKGTSLGSKAFSSVVGLGKGATAGFGPALAGGVGASIDAIMDDKSRPFIERYRESRDFAQQVNDRAQKANPKSFLGGELGGGLASAIVAGPESIGGNMALGGAFGLGNSKADLTKGEYGQALKDTGRGATIGGLSTLGTNILLPALVESSVPLANRFANSAAGRASQALGGKYSDKELGRKGLDLGVVRPLSSTEDMLAKTESIFSSGNSKMDQAISAADRSGMHFNPEKVAGKMEGELGNFYRSPINRDVTNQYENTLEALRVRSATSLNPQEQEIVSHLQNIVESGGSLTKTEREIMESLHGLPKENIPLREGQTLKGQLDRVAYPKGKIPLSPTDKQIMAQDASRMVRDEITNAAEGVLGKEGKDLLNQGRLEHGFGAEAAPLLEKRLDKEQARSILGLGNLAFGTAGAALMHSPVGVGAGLAVKKGIEFATKPQVQAFIGDGISKALEQAPHLLGKYAAPLQQAAARGPAALAASNFILNQKDPEYREKIRQINGQEGQGE